MEHSEEEGETKIKYFSTTEYSGGDMYGYTNAPPKEPRVPGKRPGFLTVICFFGFIASAIGLVVSLTDFAKAVGEWYPPFLILGAVASCVGYIGVWLMKTWGVYILALMFLVSATVAYAMSEYSPVSLGGSLIILLIIASQMSKMD